MLKDDALEAADAAVRAPDPALSDLCDAISTRSPTLSPTDTALASLLEWIPMIPRGCEDEAAHAFHLQFFRHYGADASSLPQSPIREQWTWVRSCAPSLPGIAEVLRAFLASLPPVQQITDNPAASPANAEAANQAAGAA